MRVKQKIIDYDSNKESIDYWFSIKCEQKYDQFIVMLENNNIDVTWDNVSGLYKYDKRLIFNTFKYISFLEEYLRAIVVRLSDNKNETYINLQKETVSGLITHIKKLDDDIILQYFQSKDFLNELDHMRELRNCISHNKIIIQEKNHVKAFNVLYEALPSTYRDNFKKEIVNSMRDIDVSRNWQIFD